jgi:tetratricopeptide (TPR) repeat protein
LSAGRFDALALAGLVALTLIAYLPLGSCRFVEYDDPEYVSENAGLRHGLSGEGLQWAATAIVSNNWHPLTLLSLLIDYQLFGLEPWGYHLHNLLLHLANTLLVFLALRHMTGAPGRSAVVAALFALHPLHVESVAWVSERKDLLSTLFGLLALLAYLWYTRAPKLVRMAVVAALLLLSLLAKPMWVTLPFLLLLLDYWPLRRLGQSPLRLLLLEKLPLFALAALFCVTTLLTQVAAPPLRGEAGSAPLTARAANAAVSYVQYLRQTFAPTDLAVLYPHPGQGLSALAVAGSVVVILAITVLTLVLARTRPYLLVGWLWYLGTLVPAIGLVQVGEQARADRYTYIPLVGIFLLLVWAVADLLDRLRKPSLGWILGAGVLLASMLHTAAQLGAWQSDLALWEQTVHNTSGNFRALNNYGGALMKEKDRYPEAEAVYDQVVQGWPARPEGYRGRGDAYLRVGKIPEAEADYRKALELDPNLSRQHHNLGLILREAGKLDEAAGHFRKSVQLEPTLTIGWVNLWGVLARLGRLEESEACLREAVRQEPGNAGLQAAHGELLLKLKRYDAAAAAFAEAVRRMPVPALYERLAVALAEGGRLSEALAAVDRGLMVADPREDQAVVASLKARRQAWMEKRRD